MILDGVVYGRDWFESDRMGSDRIGSDRIGLKGTGRDRMRKWTTFGGLCTGIIYMIYNKIK